MGISELIICVRRYITVLKKVANVAFSPIPKPKR